MTLNELVTDLENILKVHPEVGDAIVWAERPIQFIRIDNKHKPVRIRIEC